jgi:hypothetical protein
MRNMSVQQALNPGMSLSLDSFVIQPYPITGLLLKAKLLHKLTD